MYHSQSRTGVSPVYVNVGVRCIEPVNKTTEKHGSDKSGIKNDTLLE
jgi:hypothetical protein